MQTRIAGIAKIVLLSLVIISGLVVFTIRAGEYNYRPYLHDDLYLPSGKLINEISLGYKELVADMVWLSAVQYYGDYRAGNHDLAYFKGLTEITTSLDPHFIFVYIFGALVVCEDREAFTEGMEILRTGMANNPDSWELPFEIGFLNYIDRADFDMAARYFDLASRMPGRPDYVKRFAAFLYDKAGHNETSIKMWEELKTQSDEQYLKDLADRYIQKLKVKSRTKENRIDTTTQL